MSVEYYISLCAYLGILIAFGYFLSQISASLKRIDLELENIAEKLESLWMPPPEPKQ